MPIENIVFGAILLIFVVILLRAANDIGQNPYQQIREQEKLTGKFPVKMTMSERLQMINRYGISASSPKRIPILIIAVVAFVGWLFWKSS